MVCPSTCSGSRYSYSSHTSSMLVSRYTVVLVNTLKPAAIENLLAQLGDFGIEQRLTPANGDHWRATLVHGLQALLERQSLADRCLVLPNAPATGARKVAGMQRLQHHHQREALVDHGMWLVLA